MRCNAVPRRHGEGTARGTPTGRVQRHRVAGAESGAAGSRKMRALPIRQTHERRQFAPPEPCNVATGRVPGGIVAPATEHECVGPAGWIIVEKKKIGGRPCEVRMFGDREKGKPEIAGRRAKQRSKRRQRPGTCHACRKRASDIQS
ncbi:hypothetical protein SmB9_32550 [Sphingosinicella microcystinivorans]|uniref:Uncharacterized protein n=1 Tax=Sphingosinicella microcystinivorans TaxID=335406 RepID=A0AAD1D8Y9_SPHMI|nr:hypothetical protein SmB9_32550 [Sphingosinicella microcystinivorans]